MNGGVAAAAAPAAAVKSVLDKPLHELTEDDISQLTREDCRRYLKEKGMRRPSWNKSQAIQQVISLKSLLEPSPPKPPRLPPTTPTVTSNSCSSVKELSPADVEGSVCASAENGSPNKPSDSSGLEPSREGESCHAAGDSIHVSDRCADGGHLPIEQMTIFYSGKVNVYDGVPVDKQAQAIVHLAACPTELCLEEANSGNSTHWSSQARLSSSISKSNANVATPGAAILPSMLADVEGQTNRQVSLQRYFEKRKDRGKFKMKRKLGSSSGLELYLNHQMLMPVVNGQPAQSNTRSPSQVGMPCPAYGFTHKQLKNPGLFVDLNDKA